MSLKVILDIVATFLIGAISAGGITGIVTYNVQRAKIREMKKAFRADIREEAKRSFHNGYNVGVAEAIEVRDNMQEEARNEGYERGFDAGIKHEKMINPVVKSEYYREGYNDGVLNIERTRTQEEIDHLHRWAEYAVIAGHYGEPVCYGGDDTQVTSKNTIDIRRPKHRDVSGDLTEVIPKLEKDDVTAVMPKLQ